MNIFQYTMKLHLSQIFESRLELLNDFTFTDSEWEKFFKECIANTNEGVEKTRKIQDDYIQILKREDGTTKNIYLLDKKISITIAYTELLINMKKRAASMKHDMM